MAPGPRKIASEAEYQALPPGTPYIAPDGSQRVKGGAPSQGGATFPDTMSALIQQESGGRVGVRGPQTRYGQPLGLTQLLPDTAKEMAAKLGLDWKPELLTDTSPQGADYQRALGEAYFNEGLQRTGNVRDALRYYHGGPNRALWGPKTNAYADAVLARMGG